MASSDTRKNLEGPRLLGLGFKLRFGLKLCLATLAGAAGLLALLVFSLSRGVGGSYGEALPLVFASSYAVLVLGVATAAVAAVSVLYSHRIAGPVFRLARNMEEIGSGDLTVVTRLRGKDQLVELAEDLNSMVRSVNHSARSAADAIEALEKAEEELYVLLERGGPHQAGAREAVREIRENAKRLQQALSGVKTHEGA
jgi:methyl-accepting chemotaxis protein